MKKDGIRLNGLGEDLAERFWLDKITLLLSLLCLSAFYFGLRVLLIAGLAVVAGLLFDLLSRLFCRLPLRADLSIIVMALTLSLLMPASVSYHVPMIGMALGVFLINVPYESPQKPLFNPVAGAFCLLAVFFREDVFRYPAVKLHQLLPFSWNIEPVYGDSIAETLLAGGIPSVREIDLLIGRVPGPMGGVFLLLLLACFLMLCFCRRGVVWTSLFYLAAAAVTSCFFQRIPVPLADRITLELVAGGLIFSAFFIATDPATSPNLAAGRAIYGCLLGIFSILFRQILPYPVVEPFAILLLSPFARSIDQMTRRPLWRTIIHWLKKPLVS